MQSIEYQITAPKKIKRNSVNRQEPDEKGCLVRVSHTQVCDADAKYYYGLRPKFYSIFGFRYFYGVRNEKKFMSKYPLVPFHEAIGLIEKAGKKTKLQLGTRVVLIPNIPCENPECEYCSTGNENYCEKSKFMSSNAPGFARTFVILPENCVARIPDEVPNEIAIHTEMSTVAYGGIIASEIKKEDIVAVFGDGYLSLILSALLSNVFNLPREKLVVFGIHDDKLFRFSEFSNTINLKKQKTPELKFTKIFECVGKRSAEETLDIAIRIIKPKGTITLLGVSEEKVPINTRNILSKSITLRGVSRSPAKYYPLVLQAMRSKRLQKILNKIVGKKIKITSDKEIKKSFEEFMINRKKVLMEW
ncbi:MAG: alcohol dehydrogenase catalytic domain-containing protein [archaeon]|nr:alcohol dehydrogenase catalytic domain-containing protein [archaeon]